MSNENLQPLSNLNNPQTERMLDRAREATQLQEHLTEASPQTECTLRFVIKRGDSIEGETAYGVIPVHLAEELRGKLMSQFNSTVRRYGHS